MATSSLNAVVADEEWARVFEAVGRRVRHVVLPHLGTEAGRVEIGVGAGGDRTVELDRLAEEVALSELRRFADRGARFSVLSEEAGLVDMGSDYPRVMLDPVDGSTNAKQGLPAAAVMLCLVDGARTCDARVGSVANLLTGERWLAVRGRGLLRDGSRVTPIRPRRPGRISLLGLETSPRDLGDAQPLIDRSSKLRLFGCMALTLAHTAAGAIEVCCAPMQARIFDMTAGLLMLGEIGGVATDMVGRRLSLLGADLEARSTMLASADPGMHRLALEALRTRGGGPYTR